MSIKDLFERSTNYVSDTDQKDAFSDAESSRNVKAISEKQNTFVPQVDYNDPLSFARFGSAELYYEGAIDRIIDFYPYDGSDAEYNEFFNKSLDIEKFIFNNLYPRTNGYVNFSSSSIFLLPLNTPATEYPKRNIPIVRTAPKIISKFSIILFFFN